MPFSEVHATLKCIYLHILEYLQYQFILITANAVEFDIDESL